VIGVFRFISRGAWLFPIVSAVLAAVVSAGTAESAAAGATRQAETVVTYRDAVGEDALAPDISSIVVAAGNARDLSFRVNIPNRPALTDDMRLRIWLDADHDLSTGLTAQNLLGVDYFILVDRWELGLGVARLFACKSRSAAAGRRYVRLTALVGRSASTLPNCGSSAASACDLGSSHPAAGHSTL
jgi:hypothetical protein